AGAYLAANPDREGGVKIAAPHPARSLRSVAGPDRPEDRIRTARFSRLHQADEPILQRRLVVVDEGHETRTAGIETGIAGDGDVARRTMDIPHRQIELPGEAKHEIPRARHLVVVSDDDAYPVAF